MPDLLLELRSEEIPARMQRKAAGDLRKMVTDGLVDAGLTYEAAREYWTPRRLALDIRGLTARSKDVQEEIKGVTTANVPVSQFVVTPTTLLVSLNIERDSELLRELRPPILSLRI